MGNLPNTNLALSLRFCGSFLDLKNKFGYKHHHYCDANHEYSIFEEYKNAKYTRRNPLLSVLIEKKTISYSNRNNELELVHLFNLIESDNGILDKQMKHDSAIFEDCRLSTDFFHFILVGDEIIMVDFDYYAKYHKALDLFDSIKSLKKEQSAGLLFDYEIKKIDFLETKLNNFSETILVLLNSSEIIHPFQIEKETLFAIKNLIDNKMVHLQEVELNEKDYNKYINFLDYKIG